MNLKFSTYQRNLLIICLFVLLTMPPLFYLYERPVDIYYRLATIALIFSTTINFALAILILIGNPRSEVHKFFSILIALIGLWNFVNLGAQVSPTIHGAYIWAQLAIAVAFFIPAIYLHLTYIFPKIVVLNKRQVFYIYLPPILSLPFVPTKWNIVSLESARYNAEVGQLYIFFTVYFIIYFSYSFFRLLRNKRSVETKIRQQINIVVFGSLCLASVGIITNSILPLMGIRTLDIYGTPFAIIFSFAVTYALLRYQFLNFRTYTTVENIIRFTAFVGTIGIAVFASLWLVFLDLHLVTLIYCFVMLGIFFPLVVYPALNNFLTKFARRLTLTDIINPADKSLHGNFDIPKNAISFFDREIKKLCDRYPLSPQLTFIAEPETQRLVSVHPKIGVTVLESTNVLVENLKRVTGLLTMSEALQLFHEPIVSKLKQTHSDIILPMGANGILSGLLFFKLDVPTALSLDHRRALEKEVYNFNLELFGMLNNYAIHRSLRKLQQETSA